MEGEEGEEGEGENCSRGNEGILSVNSQGKNQLFQGQREKQAGSEAETFSNNLLC